MKKHYLDFDRKAVTINSIQRLVADMQDHVHFLVRSNNIDELQKIETKFASFLSSVKVEFLNSLPDNE